MSQYQDDRERILLVIDTPPYLNNPIRCLKDICQQKYPDAKLFYLILPDLIQTLLRPRFGWFGSFIEHILLYFNIFLDKRKTFFSRNIKWAIDDSLAERIIFLKIVPPQEKVIYYTSSSRLQEIISRYCYGLLDNYHFARDYILKDEYPEYYFPEMGKKQKHGLLFVDFQEFNKNPVFIYNKVGIRRMAQYNISFYPTNKPKKCAKLFTQLFKENKIEHLVQCEAIE